MVYSFDQLGASGYDAGGRLFQHRQRWWLRLHEKGGKRHELPCHPEEFRRILEHSRRLPRKSIKLESSRQ